MRVLLISTYELGHQPLHVASPAAALLAAGHEVRTIDLAVEHWHRADVEWAEALALSVPMHTAMRLAVRAAAAVRDVRPELPICLYGLYATVGRDATLRTVADRLIAGEYERELVAWVDARAGPGSPGDDAGAREVDRGPTPFRVPSRGGLPPVDRYARLAMAGEQRMAGYVEASHGCVHRCRHCPVPVVYDGRIRVVPVDTVLADVEQLVRAGARHVTFGDPDFLNAVHHSQRVVDAVHAAFPTLTFDCTAKIEHVLRHDTVWGAWAAAGCLFVVSAVECLDDATLVRLDKGHTAADAARAVALLRHHGIEMRPSFMPFTPWTTPATVLDIVDFVAALDLIDNVDPVQYTIRLLLPDGSLLLSHPDLQPHLGPYDPALLTWTWRSPDPRVDELQVHLARLVEERQRCDTGALDVYREVRAVVRSAGGDTGDAGDAPEAVPLGAVAGRPRLTEPWFC